ncbi:MAG TPA: PilZ domain-containing protein [Vicinamibacterales bacterium]|nr:PilZ domain-containing protein [Vicinamibacterales bacterium]
MASDWRQYPHSGVESVRTPPHGTPTGTERRRGPRVRVRGRLPASFTTVSMPILIRNISLGGMLIASSEPFPVGATHQLRIAMNEDDSDVPVLTAQIVYCQSEYLPDGTTAFLTGFMFTSPQDEQAQRRVFDLIEKAT